MSRLNRLSLVHQIALAAGLISLIVFGTLVTFTTYFAEKADLAKTGDELGHQIQGVVRMLELNHAGAVARAGSRRVMRGALLSMTKDFSSRCLWPSRSVSTSVQR